MLEALTCADLERLGLWNTRGCCEGCHREIAAGSAQIELEPECNRQGRASRARLVLCCNCSPSGGVLLDRALYARAFKARREVRRAFRELTRLAAANDVPASRFASVVDLEAARAAR